MRQSLFKTALVLSGGAARGLSHLGLLEELQKNEIQVDLIVGTSMGAIIGALYAYYGNAAPATEKMRELLESDLFSDTLSLATENAVEEESETVFQRFFWLFKKGFICTQSMVRSTLVPETTYSEVVSRLIPDCDIEDLSVPFAAIAMDIINGKEVVLTTGSLRKAVLASAAIPGLLPPIAFNGRSLVDGGWVDNVPVAPAISMGAHFVIAADASLQISDLGALPITALDYISRSNAISRMILNHQQRSVADILLVPELGQMNWADFAGIDRCLEAGRNVFSDNVRHIRRKKMIRQLRSLGGLLHPARRGNWRREFIMD